MPQCEICGESLADDHKVLGQHLWEQHHITPNDYRIRYLGLSPKCKRPGCNNPVPRSADGRWFKCCSPFCALEMGEDIPVPF
jgi:hypothetical protein